MYVHAILKNDDKSQLGLLAAHVRPCFTESHGRRHARESRSQLQRARTRKHAHTHLVASLYIN